MKTQKQFSTKRFSVALGRLLITAAFCILCSRARAQLYVGQRGTDGIVGTYDPITGATLNATFIPSGLDTPLGLALSGNNLFVANSGSGIVGQYNATSGAAINANFITGLGPTGGILVSGNTLYVVTGGGIGEYNATTGAVINASFISVFGPNQLAPSGGVLYVSHGGGGTGNVSAYNAVTGATLASFSLTGLNSAVGLAVSGGVLLVAERGANRVGEYSAATGMAINADFITGVKPYSLAILGSSLYVGSFDPFGPVANNFVGEYDATTGATINASFVPGVGPESLAVQVVPEPSTWAIFGLGIAALLGFRRFNRRSTRPA